MQAADAGGGLCRSRGRLAPSTRPRLAFGRHLPKEFLPLANTCDSASLHDGQLLRGRFHNQWEAGCAQPGTGLGREGQVHGPRRVTAISRRLAIPGRSCQGPGSIKTGPSEEPLPLLPGLSLLLSMAGVTSRLQVLAFLSDPRTVAFLWSGHVAVLASNRLREWPALTASWMPVL